MNFFIIFAAFCSFSVIDAKNLAQGDGRLRVDQMFDRDLSARGNLRRQENDQRNTSCGSCSGRLQWGDEGVISSPNYPNPYSANLDCMWLLRAADEDAKIELECSEIQLQSCGAQNGFSPAWKDYLIISPSANFLMSWVYCGYSTAMGPIKHTSTGDQMTLIFRSSKTGKRNKGFKCHYKVV